MNIKIAGTIFLLISLGNSLVGCTIRGNGSSVLPRGGPTMSEIYKHQYYFNSDYGQIDKVRSQVPGTSYKAQHVNDQHVANDASYNQSSSDTPRMLPNPMISVYVYPHFDGDDQDYVPGHMAYTKLYKETHFALPGEPTEM